MMRIIQRAAAAAGAVWVGAVLVACGSGGSATAATSTAPAAASSISPAGSNAPVAPSTAGHPATTGAGGDAVAVVASTNVWGDVVAQVGGPHVDVVSIISDPGADPHSYEANAQNQLALSKAAMVIENGGGYDDFIDTMLAAANSSAPVINAVQVSGKQAVAGAELNEHVWYDFPTVDRVAQQIAVELSAKDPAHEAEFTANAKTFSAALGELTTQVQAVKTAHAGTGVAVTEPVPLYLLEAAGLVNLTPPEFTAAIEQATDVPAPVLNETLALFTDQKVKALFYNEQTTGPQTEAVLNAAKTNSIAVVPVRETLPEGQDYLTWMKANVQAMARAVGG